MEKRKVELKNPEGLHARPAALFVKVANRYESELDIQSEARTVNGKSIIGIMSLGAFQGEEITLITRGSDEKEMADALAKLIEEGFQEV
jgi:phosphotransferase system HPr (HPr) family protein